MRPQPDKKKKKFHIGKGMRHQIYAWSALVGVVLLIGFTFAWYSLQKREAETETATVMKPYYLALHSEGDSDGQLLSIGSLPSGQVRQIVFCVTNAGESEVFNEDTSAFEYALELVYTDNLPLQYTIYPLTGAAEGGQDVITSVDVPTVGESTQTQTAYWKKSGEALTGKDISEDRRKEAGLGEKNDSIVNRGNYFYYETMEVYGEDDETTTKSLELAPTSEEPIAYQYFLLEIQWSTTENIGKYDKETDMIYLLAKAVQPEPTEASDD